MCRINMEYHEPPVGSRLAGDDGRDLKYGMLHFDRAETDFGFCGAGGQPSRRIIRQFGGFRSAVISYSAGSLDRRLIPL
jgi:hypothetical protein